MENFAVLLNENLDILKEIGSIGMGHATTSLAQMLNMKVTMTIPTVNIMSLAEACDYLKTRRQSTIGVMIRLQGDSKGMILQLLSREFALHVINYFFQTDETELGELDEMSLSVVQEIGNITSGAYCNSLASMTGLFIDISTPTHCMDLDESYGFAQGRSEKECAIIINNSFFAGEEKVTSDFLFMPDETTTKMVLEKLKEYYGFTVPMTEDTTA